MKRRTLLAALLAPVLAPLGTVLGKGKVFAHTAGDGLAGPRSIRFGSRWNPTTGVTKWYMNGEQVAESAIQCTCEELDMRVGWSCVCEHWYLSQKGEFIIEAFWEDTPPGVPVSPVQNIKELDRL